MLAAPPPAATTVVVLLLAALTGASKARRGRRTRKDDILVAVFRGGDDRTSRSFGEVVRGPDTGGMLLFVTGYTSFAYHLSLVGVGCCWYSQEPSCQKNPPQAQALKPSVSERTIFGLSN